jgi:hypothetical protein
LNDLWRFDGASWTWIAGDSLRNGLGNAGPRGLASAEHIPSARLGAAYWTDDQGIFWLFGRMGDFQDLRNDLWKFDGAAWTWVAGDTINMPSPRYGTLGSISPDNVPGGHGSGAGWATEGGIFVFGGYGVDVNIAEGEMNDVWQFNHAGWGWVAGSSTADPLGSYGTRGFTAITNTPGGRTSPAYATIHGGVLIFGGSGREQTGSLGPLGDLWFIDGTRWTWLAGSRFTNSPGVYGARGVPDADNTPGARVAGVMWPGTGKTVWLFGGSSRNDLWRWDGN